MLHVGIRDSFGNSDPTETVFGVVKLLIRHE